MTTKKKTTKKSKSTAADKTKDDIVSFLKEMDSHRTEGSNSVNFYTINTEVTLKAPLDNCSYVVYVSKCLCEEFESKEKFVSHLKSEGYIQETIDHRLACGDLYKEGRIKVRKNKLMFLLRSEAEQHLKDHPHWYSKDALVVEDQTFPAPRQTTFFRDLCKHFKVSVYCGRS